MSITLTISSEREYSRISMGKMTPEMAAEYLREGKVTVRTLADVLNAYCPDSDVKDRLVKAWTEDQPEASVASVSKTVRNWLSDRTRPGSRLDVFHIAFALNLTESQADYLLGFCTGNGIHYRDALDVIYAWFLRNSRTFKEAEAFYQTLPPAPRVTMLPDQYITGIQLTHEMQNMFMQVGSEEDLRACYMENLENFGCLHLRAYHYFNRYMNFLMHPGSAWNDADEGDYSLDAVMNLYLSMNMPTGRNRKRYNAAQKLIKHNWPNATLLKNIRLRKEDVPRKLLLLLYIVTENLTDDDYSEMDEEYMTMQDRLEDHWYGINAILADCGMPLLDPRNPFDWLVLYCLAADDEPMSERMEMVIDTLFEQEEKQE